MLYMDIDYMQDYKDFTVNPEEFPDFKAFVEEMKAQNIHLVPIIDAGVKIEDGYDIYEEEKKIISSVNEKIAPTLQLPYGRVGHISRMS